MSFCWLFGHRYEFVGGTSPLVMFCPKCGKVRRVVA